MPKQASSFLYAASEVRMCGHVNLRNTNAPHLAFAFRRIALFGAGALPSPWIVTTPT